MSTQDYPTFYFLQWYVAGQHEEDKLFKSIIDKLALADDTSVDQEIASTVSETSLSPGLRSGTKKRGDITPRKTKTVCHYSVPVMQPTLTDSAIIEEKMTGDIIPYWYYPCL